MKELRKRWPENGETMRGFALVEVAEGYTFRSVSQYADLIRALREQRPVRLSKPALRLFRLLRTAARDQVGDRLCSRC